jgi:hypothetical protein
MKTILKGYTMKKFIGIVVYSFTLATLVAMMLSEGSKFYS